MYNLRFISALLICAVVLTGCLSTDQEKAAENTSTTKRIDEAKLAKIVQVVASEFSAKRIFPSTIEAAKHSDLAFRVSGQLEVLLVQSGDKVKKGQVLAKLDQSDYRNALSDRQARYDLAKLKFNQVKSLIDKKYASKARLDEATANLKAAQAALSVAQDNLNHTVLKAPFDGVIAKVNIENHQPVLAQRTVFLLQDASTLDVRFSVPEGIISRVNPTAGTAKVCGLVYFSNANKPIPACYLKHESVSDPVTRTYKVTFAMQNQTDMSILPGMTADLEVDLTDAMNSSARANWVQVPLEAVFDRAGKAYVWRLDQDMRARLTAVVADKIEGDLLLVEGLTVGDDVIAAGVGFVEEGQKVRPIVKERGL